MKVRSDACNGQHNVPGEGFDHSETRGSNWMVGCHLLCDVAHLSVHIIEQAGKIGHDACRQDAFDPVGNGLRTVSIQ